MNPEWSQDEIQETMKKVIARSSTDAQFRELALSDPNKAVFEVAGKAVPDGIKVRFVDNEHANFTVVLPDLRSTDMSELSDQELEQVAGGRGACATSCAVTSTVTLTVSAAIACI